MSDHDDYTDEHDDSALVKDLRAQIKNLTAAKSAAESELTTVKASLRTTSVADILKAKGAKPAIAKFIGNDVEATEDAITAWLTENGELFGFDPASAGTGDAKATEAPAGPDLTQFADVARTEQAGEQIALVGTDRKLAELAALKGKGFEAVEQFLTQGVA